MTETGLTLEQAIRHKYCWQEANGAPGKGALDERALGYKPGSCPVEKLFSIVLDEKGIHGVGDEKELSKLCPRVEELHLSHNLITRYNDVIMILKSVPCLKIVDLSHNHLDSTTFQPNGQFSSCLTTLVLNGTAIGWGALETCLQGIQQLQELHLSMNDYTAVSSSESFSHSNLKRLHFNENKIKDWAEFVKLGQAFPNLQTLIACGNPIEDIPELTADMFPSLHTLNLNGSSISCWTSIERLNAPCMLKELSLLKIPLGRELKEKLRRQAFIARLPGISKLNKSVITEAEREAAERWLLRDMVGKLDLPAVYHDLVKKHGELLPLAKVDMKPVETVMLEFHFEGVERAPEEREVLVNQTLWQLKTWIASNFLSVPPSGFKLYHNGTKLLKHNQKYLYSYRFRDGAQILVEIRTGEK